MRYIGNKVEMCIEVCEIKNPKYLIKKFEKLIDEKFAKCPFDKRTELFEELENFAKNELHIKYCEIFLTALYNAQSTQDVQLTIGLEKAIERIIK